jgi:hypothetical protein
MDHREAGHHIKSIFLELFVVLCLLSALKVISLYLNWLQLDDWFKEIFEKTHKGFSFAFYIVIAFREFLRLLRTPL